MDTVNLNVSITGIKEPKNIRKNLFFLKKWMNYQYIPANMPIRKKEGANSGINFWLIRE
jgi:hypothetical protein